MGRYCFNIIEFYASSTSLRTILWAEPRSCECAVFPIGLLLQPYVPIKDARSLLDLTMVGSLYPGMQRRCINSFLRFFLRARVCCLDQRWGWVTKRLSCYNVASRN